MDRHGERRDLARFARPSHRDDRSDPRPDELIDRGIVLNHWSMPTIGNCGAKSCRC